VQWLYWATNNACLLAEEYKSSNSTAGKHCKIIYHTNNKVVKWQICFVRLFFYLLKEVVLFLEKKHKRTDG
jgi:hypothetical protein